MLYRPLGKTGITVSAIGFGSWQIGGGWGPQDDQEALRALGRALELGVTFFDSAMGYGAGHAERLIGQAVKGRRDKVVLATKIPTKAGRWPVLPHEPLSTTFPARWIIACTEQSLRAFDTDYLDLQQFHAWTPGYLQDSEWQEAVQRLKEQGKIRAWGVSANDWDPYGPVGLTRSGLADSIQVIYNIFEQRPQEQLFPAALEHGVGIIARVPFDEGLLTGRLQPGYSFAAGDWRAEWLTPERLAEAAPRVEALKAFLNAGRPTLASLALRYCLSHPAVSTVIPGMRSVAHVEANCAAVEGPLLTAEELRALAAHAWAHDWPYPWAQQAH
jgi:aryl-alcohol dehydrogenase-like predicted oxidoreductase